MILALYNCTSAQNVVHKNKTNVRNVSGQLMEGTTIENPIITIEYFGSVNFNYVYIGAFGRYYFIDNMEMDEGQNVTLHLSVDVLSSFWDRMKKSQCIALRSSSNYNKYLDDKEVVKLPTSRYIFRKLSTKFTPSDGAGNYVLTLGGGN